MSLDSALQVRRSLGRMSYATTREEALKKKHDM